MNIEVEGPKISLTLTLEQNLIPFIWLRTSCGMCYILDPGLGLLYVKAKTALSLSKKQYYVQTRLAFLSPGCRDVLHIPQKGLVLGNYSINVILTQKNISYNN